MYKLLAKYLGPEAVFRSPDEPAAPPPGDGAGAPAPEQTPGATQTSEGVNTGDPAPKPAGSVEPPAPGQTALGKAAAAAKGEKPADPPADPKAAEWKEYEPDATKSAEENAAAKAEHDKTKPAAETPEAKAAREAAEAAAKAKGEKTPEQVEQEAKALAESYKLDPPEGFELNKDVEAKFRAIAGKQGWSQETVDALKGVQIELYQKQAEAHAATVTQWGEDLKKDPELGGQNHDAKLGVAGAVLNEFFSPTIAKLMDDTGIGNHPEFVRGFYKLGLAVGELPTFQNRPGFGGKEDIINILYPDAKR